MIYETLDNGAFLTDEAVDKLVTNAYAALERGAYKVIPNPHKKTEPLRLSEQQRVALLKIVTH